MRGAAALTLVLLVVGGCGSQATVTGAPSAPSAPEPTATASPAEVSAAPDGVEVTGKAAAKILDDAIGRMRQLRTGTYVERGSFRYPAGPAKESLGSESEYGKFDLDRGRFYAEERLVLAGLPVSSDRMVVGRRGYVRNVAVNGTDRRFEWYAYRAFALRAELIRTARFGSTALPASLELVTATKVRRASADAGGLGTVHGTATAPLVLIAAGAALPLDAAGVDFATLEGEVPIEIAIGGDGTIARIEAKFADVQFTARKKPSRRVIDLLRATTFEVDFRSAGATVAIVEPEDAVPAGAAPAKGSGSAAVRPRF